MLDSLDGRRPLTKLTDPGKVCMERQMCTYLQIIGHRYKSFIPIFKSFVPSLKSFTPRYK